MDSEKVRERVRSRVEGLDGVMVAIGLSMVLLGSVMVGSGVAGVVTDERTREGAGGVAGQISPVNTVSAQESTQNGSLFAATDQGYVARIDAGNGNITWNQSIGVSGDLNARDPLVVSGVVYSTFVDSNDDSGSVVAYSMTGEKQWQVNYTSDSGPTTPISYANGSVFFMTYNDTLVSLDASTGSKNWASNVGIGDAGFSPPEYYEESVYVVAGGSVKGFDEYDGSQTFSQSVSSNDLVGINIEDEGLSNASAFVSAGLNNDAYRVSLEGSGSIVWQTSVTIRDGMIVDNGTVYGDFVSLNASDGSVNYDNGGTGDSPAYYRANDSLLYGEAGGTYFHDATTGEYFAVVQDSGDKTPTIAGGVSYSIYQADSDFVAVDIESKSVEWRTNSNIGIGESLTYVSAGSTMSDGTFVKQDTSIDIGPVEPCEGLWVDTREYMSHNLTVDYRILAYDDTKQDWVDITDNATVSTSNPNALTASNGTLTSTTNKSINEIVQVQADYGHLSGTADVTVATETVNNTDILPPMQSATAMIGDDNGLVVVIATAIGAGVAVFASSLAGVAAFPVVIAGAWVAGFVGTHVLLGGLLMSIFVGLNVAQVVSYGGE